MLHFLVIIDFLIAANRGSDSMTDETAGLKGALGGLILGGYDKSLFTPNNKSSSFANDNVRNLVVGIQSITTEANNGIKTPINLLPTSTLSLIDAGVSHIWLPLESCLAFEEEFGLTLDSTTGLYVVNDTLHSVLLTRNASITFTLSDDRNTIDIILPYSSFDLELTSNFPGIINTTRYFPIRRAVNDTQNTLGRTFLQEAYLIADYERSTFSVSQSIFSECHPSNVQAIYPKSDNSSSPNASGPPPFPGQLGLFTGAITGIAVGAMVVGLCLLAGIFSRNRVLRKRRALREGEPDIPAELHNSDVDLTRPKMGELSEDSTGLPELPDPQGPMAELEVENRHRVELQGSIPLHELAAPLGLAHERP